MPKPRKGQSSRNAYRSLNDILYGGSALALVRGATSGSVPIAKQRAAFWLFVLFCALLRLKMYFDDRKYFDTVDINDRLVHIGFFFGFVGWFAWIVGGWEIEIVPLNCFAVGAAILLATAWIFLDAIRVGAYREQYIWIVTNIAFVIMLVFAYLYSTPAASWVRILVFCIGLLILGADFFYSKSMSG